MKSTLIFTVCTLSLNVGAGNLVRSLKKEKGFPGGMFGGPHEGMPGGPHEGMFGGPHAGMPGGMGGRESNDTEFDRHHGGGPMHFLPGIKFFNDTCIPDTSNNSTCVVGFPMDESNGAWVCRTLFDIVTGESDTFSACVDTHEFIETDTCGCCKDECPSMDPCPCTCDMVMMKSEDMDFNSDFKNVSGVLVKEKGSDETRCVPTEVANKMINGPGLFGRSVCVEECR